MPARSLRAARWRPAPEAQTASMPEQASKSERIEISLYFATSSAVRHHHHHSDQRAGLASRIVRRRSVPAKTDCAFIGTGTDVSSGIDVIGDVHGQFDRLIALLKHLGYRQSAGAWRHPGRRAIFLGDLIDRGPKQLATVDLVRRMVDAGTARCVMGNHELN